MDSDSQPPQNHLHQLQYQHQNPLPPPPPQQNHHFVGPTNNNNTPPPPLPRTIISPPHQFQHQQLQNVQNVQNIQNANSRFQFNSAAAAAAAMAPTNLEFSDGNVNVNSSPKGSGLGVEQPKKKRGRPRKYSPEGGGVGLGLSPSSGSGGNYSGGGNGTDSGAKRSRGRPPGSGKKQLDVLGGAGIGLTPHLIYVKSGEDISSKIMAFAQQGPRNVCILSATGSICNATLRQASTSGGNITYEGRYEIMSLAGSFTLSENHSRTGGMSISLAGSDGKVVGGSVAGMLIAATPVQVIVGSFLSDFKKLKAKPPSAAPILNFSAPAAGVASSPSQGASSESSEENHDSPLNNGPVPFSNAGQTMQNMAMYSPIAWPNSSIKMPPS